MFGELGPNPIASPTLTGVPAAPTAIAGTNTAQIATTAFVAGGISIVNTMTSPTFGLAADPCFISL